MAAARGAVEMAVPKAAAPVEHAARPTAQRMAAARGAKLEEKILKEKRRKKV